MHPLGLDAVAMAEALRTSGAKDEACSARARAVEPSVESDGLAWPVRHNPAPADSYMLGVGGICSLEHRNVTLA